MDFIMRYGCPFVFSQAWMMWAFILLPSLLAALGARLGQGSALRIATATMGAGLRDGVLLLLIFQGKLTPTNSVYDVYAGLMLLTCVVSGAMLGSTLTPYRGFFLLLMSGLGALAGHWAFTLLPLVYFWQRQRRQNLALPLN